jgi:hypothetical protein
MRQPSAWPAAIWLTTAAIAIVAFCLGAMVDRRAFFACWLAAWWTCAGAVLGAQANLWLHDLTGGAWGARLRPVWQRMASSMPMLLALMLPLVLATWTFYPWSDPSWAPHTRAPDFQAFWLSPSFVTVRLILYGAIWQVLSLISARRREGSRKVMSAFGLIIYGYTISLACIDLIASLIPEWHSSGFGLVAITMQMKLGFAAGVVCATAGPATQGTTVRTASDQPRRPDPAPTFPAQLGRDWGNMLLMYVMMWAYLAFVQFLIIWAENLPAEIAWYVPRLQTGWIWLGAVLVVAGFFAPQLLLLMRAIKQDRRRLRAMAIALCAIGGLESIWVVLPSVPGLTWHALWMAPLALAGMAALLWVMAMPVERRRPSESKKTIACETGSEP